MVCRMGKRQMRGDRPDWSCCLATGLCEPNTIDIAGLVSFSHVKWYIHVHVSPPESLHAGDNRTDLGFLKPERRGQQTCDDPTPRLRRRFNGPTQRLTLNCNPVG